MYLQCGVFLWLPRLEFGDSVIPNVFTVWCISSASHVEFGDSVIANVFTVWCIS